MRLVCVGAVAILAFGVGWIRVQDARLPPRSVTAGMRSFAANDGEMYTILHNEEAYADIQIAISRNSVCGRGPPLDRPSTPVLHFHENSAETFSVMAGEMGLMHSGQHRVLRSIHGSVKIAARSPHTFWLEGDEDLGDRTVFL
jgi:hypothetical protein